MGSFSFVITSRLFDVFTFYFCPINYRIDHSIYIKEKGLGEISWGVILTAVIACCAVDASIRVTPTDTIRQSSPVRSQTPSQTPFWSDSSSPLQEVTSLFYYLSIGLGITLVLVILSVVLVVVIVKRRQSELMRNSSFQQVALDDTENFSIWVPRAHIPQIQIALKRRKRKQMYDDQKKKSSQGWTT